MFAKELFVLLMVFGSVFYAAIAAPISACTEITSPGGYYVLTTNISGNYDSTTHCLGIYADNVTVDCNGYMISDATSVNVDINAQNVTLKNCIIKGADYGIYILGNNNTILDNTVFKSTLSNLVLKTGNYNLISGNTFHATGKDSCVIVGSGMNALLNNEAYDCTGHGFFLGGKQHQVEGNTAHNSYYSGFRLDVRMSNITRNIAYNNDWDAYEGGGFEITGFYNTISSNTAYDNTNGFYIEGPLPSAPLAAAAREFGNAFTDNYAHDNLIGLNVIDNNGTYKNNILEENSEADFLVGGDAWFGGALRGEGLRVDTARNPEVMCDNIFENIGSGGREIYFTNKTVTLSSGTYSEVVLCDADESKISGLTVSGSDELDNNGMILFYTDDASIRATKSKDNFMGFGFVKSDRDEVTESNSDGSGIGIASALSKDLLVAKHTSTNNRMDSTLLFDLLQVILGGTLTGEPARAAERPDIGAGAILLYSPRATFEDVSFSESTMGALFLMSDESKISGGKAVNNDLIGYGYVDSYNGTMSGAVVSGNDGNIYDVLGERIPPRYEMLELLPLGAGVFDLSTSVLGIVPVTGGELGYTGSTSGCTSYTYCVMEYGEVCDFDSGECIEGTFENRYENSRVYENNYGLVLLNRGHEVVYGCSVYDNNVLGILDVSDILEARPPAGSLGFSVEAPRSKSITLTKTSMFRNGEQVFATFADLFEQAGMEGWYHAFSLMDKSIPKGVLEFEFVEASAIYDMIGAPASRSSTPVPSDGPWLVNHSIIGAGTSSVEFSTVGNLKAVYLFSDTTLPSISKISVEDEELGIDLTAHFQNEGVKDKSPFFNKYFIVGAVGEDPHSLGAPAPIGPSLNNFQVHYGPTSSYDPNTMGLYYLEIYDQGWYCEVDRDCPRNEPPMHCYENMCVKEECTEDSDCELTRTPRYCVGYQCGYCRDDSDCTDGDKNTCRNGDCGRAFCIQDSECAEGLYCDITMARCVAGPVVPPLTGGSTAFLPPLSQIANQEVAIRASTPTTGDVILKGRWVPVTLQYNDVSQRTINVTQLIQKDRTRFINEMFGGIIPEGYLVYGDIYGLFATAVPGEEGGEKYAPECDPEKSDCGECEFCSVDNKQCMPKSEADCGYFGKECTGEGYTCEGCRCVAPECGPNKPCGEGEKCLDYSCVEDKPPEEPKEEEPEQGETGEEGGQVTPPPVQVIPEPEEEKPAYPLVTVEVPSVEAPKQPLSEAQAEFQMSQIGLVLLLLLGIVGAYLWFRLRKAPVGKGKKGE